MQYRREIDGLRALAVLPVILFHAGIDAFSGGYVGVDIFFVISGYLITSIIMTEKESGTYSVVKFYERRARRILPALFFVMAACIPFSWFFLLSSDMKDFSQSLAAVPVFLSNFLFWRETNYFSGAAELKPLLHTWSLAVEEQFYILFPVFIGFVWRFGKSKTVGFISFVSILSLIFAHWSAYSWPSLGFYLLPARVWELGVGALIAFYLLNRGGEKHASLHNQIYSLVGFLLVVFSILFFDESTPFPSFFALVPVVGTGFIILFCTPMTLVGRLLGGKFFVGVGLVSYSAYLWHQPLFAFARHISLEEPSKAFFLLLSVVSLVLAFFTWRYIESPFRKREVFSRQAIFIFGFIGSLFFILFGLYGYYSGGFPERFSGDILKIDAASKSYSNINCEADGFHNDPDVMGCKLGGGGNFLGDVVGDSHAASLLQMLSENLTAHDARFNAYFYSGCPHVFGFYRRGNYVCGDYSQVVRDKTIKNDGKYIIIVARWTMYLEGDRFDNEEGGIEYGGDLWFDADSDMDSKDISPVSRRKRIERAYKKTIFYYLNSGKKVILVYPIPEAGWNVPYYAAKRVMRGVVDDLSASHEVFKKRNKAAIDVLDSIGEHENLVRVKPENIFCDSYIQDRCVLQMNGIPLYVDTNHLSNYGAGFIVQEIMKNIIH